MVGIRKKLTLEGTSFYFVRGLRCSPALSELSAHCQPVPSPVSAPAPVPPLCSRRRARQSAPVGSDRTVGMEASRPSPGLTPSLRLPSSPFPRGRPWLPPGLWKSRSPSVLLDEEKLGGVLWGPDRKAGLSLTQAGRLRARRGPPAASAGNSTADITRKPLAKRSPGPWPRGGHPGHLPQRISPKGLPLG